MRTKVNPYQQQQPQAVFNKPLSANRKDRNVRSKMEYGANEENENAGFGNFGNLEGTAQIKILKQKKRNDFVAGLEEQIRLKSERQRKEQEINYQYEYPPQPSSSHSRRSQHYSEVNNYEQPLVQPNSQPQSKPQSRGSNNLPGMDNR